MCVPARVLVVDDEAVASATWAEALAGDGHDVNMVATGEEALGKLQKGRYDMALLDLKMPGARGLRILRAFRKAAPSTEVVVVAGSPSLESAKESIRLGAFEYMTKPLALQTLRAVVSQVLACKPWRIQGRC